MLWFLIVITLKQGDIVPLVNMPKVDKTENNLSTRLMLMLMTEE